MQGMMMHLFVLQGGGDGGVKEGGLMCPQVILEDLPLLGGLYGGLVDERDQEGYVPRDGRGPNNNPDDEDEFFDFEDDAEAFMEAAMAFM